MKRKRLKEVWGDIPGYEGYYQASNLGKIKSVSRKVVGGWGETRTHRGKLLKFMKSAGYFRVHLCKLGNIKTFLVSRLVLETFVGSCPDGMEACHNDGIRSNNFIYNLRWDTKIANQKDRIKHGTSSRGELHWKTKLTEGDVINIRSEYAKENISRMELSERFGITMNALGKIIRRKTWTHLA